CVTVGVPAPTVASISASVAARRMQASRPDRPTVAGGSQWWSNLDAQADRRSSGALTKTPRPVPRARRYRLAATLGGRDEPSGGPAIAPLSMTEQIHRTRRTTTGRGGIRTCDFHRVKMAL